MVWLLATMSGALHTEGGVPAFPHLQQSLTLAQKSQSGRRGVPQSSVGCGGV